MANSTRTPTAKAMRPLNYKPSHITQQPKQSTLLLLPDVPLLHVLSFLPLKDLASVGQASPRLGELTRAHRSLWRREGRSRTVVYKDFENLLGSLRCAPPVEKLEIPCALNADDVVEVLDFYALNAELNPPDLNSVIASEMTVTGTDLTLRVMCPLALVTRVLRELGPRLKDLSVLQCHGGLGLAPLSASLREARCLTTLIINMECKKSLGSTSSWPQEVVLPSLHYLGITGSHGDTCRRHVVEIRAARSLLRVHGCQLRRVGLWTSEVLGTCQLIDIDGLSVVVKRGRGADLVAHLRNMRRLKELRLNLRDMHDDCEEVDQFLSSDRPIALGLQHLKLLNCRSKNMAAVLLKNGLIYNLQSLILKMYILPSPEVFVNVPAAAIAHLNLLIVWECPCFAWNVLGRCMCDQDQDNYSGLVSALEGLVRRAPAVPAAPAAALTLPAAPAAPAVPAALASAPPLHVVFRRCGGTSQSLLFFRHSPAESAGCPMCAEAVATARSLELDDLNPVVAEEVQYIQVL